MVPLLSLCPVARVPASDFYWLASWRVSVADELNFTKMQFSPRTENPDRENRFTDSEIAYLFLVYRRRKLENCQRLAA